MAMTGRIKSSAPLFNRLLRADALSPQTHRSTLHPTLLCPELSKNYSTASPKNEEKVKVPLALFGVPGNYASALYLVAVKGNVLDKMSGVRQFGLGEGGDASGVTTKILTCNWSIDLLIENKSKLFGLHIHPPMMDISFGRMPFAMSYGPKLYAQSSDSSIFQLYIGTRNKPMYGAGRSMQDLLELGMGLALVIRLKLSSNFRVVWNLIKPRFHHQAECLLVLDSKYDKKHRTQKYNSTCTIISLS